MDHHFPSLCWLCECTSQYNLTLLRGDVFGKAIMYTFFSWENINPLFPTYVFFFLIVHCGTSTLLTSITIFSYLSINTSNNMSFWFFSFKESMYSNDSFMWQKQYTNEDHMLWICARQHSSICKKQINMYLYTLHYHCRLISLGCLWNFLTFFFFPCDCFYEKQHFSNSVRHKYS